jgi:hypothetical protein
VDLHSDFDNVADVPARRATSSPIASLGWLAINPIDLFRAVNLSDRLEFRVPVSTTLFAVTLWFAAMLGLSLWKVRRTDL